MRLTEYYKTALSQPFRGSFTEEFRKTHLGEHALPPAHADLAELAAEVALPTLAPAALPAAAPVAVLGRLVDVLQEVTGGASSVVAVAREGVRDEELPVVVAALGRRTVVEEVRVDLRKKLKFTSE